MRWLLIVLLLAPLGAAQVAEDALGDVTIESSGSPASSPTGSATDMASLDIDETPDGFMMWVTVATTSGSGVFTEADVTFYYVDFSFHGRPYRLSLTLGTERDPVQGHETDLWRTRASVWDMADDNVIDRPEPVVEGDRIGAMVERGLIQDRDGATPGIGDDLADINVIARSVYMTEGVATFDRMPDSGAEAYAVQEGVLQTGHARLASEVPMRQSNGGAGTWVYEVVANNLADEDTFALAAEGVPEGWEVHLPFDEITLDGKQTFPVLVVTPFGHAHGDAERFTLTMTSLTDPGAVGRVELGIVYPTIPQPSGHHPTMWLHSQEREEGLDALVAVSNGWNPGITAYMNAVEDDINDEGIVVPARDTGIFSPTGATFDWIIPMSPGLELGLDFQLGQMGTLSVPIHSLGPMENVEMWGELLYESGGTTVLADLTAEGSQSMDVDTQATFDLQVVPTPEADLIPFQEGSNLVLHLFLRTSSASASEGPIPNPELLPGGTLTLPLQEYRDPVGGFIEVADGLRFASELEERAVNPGRTTVVPFTVHNDGPATDVTVAVAGLLSEWATAPGPAHIEKGGSATFEVRVEAPDDAVNGTVADLVVIAETEDRPFDRALSKFVVTVDDRRDIPDAGTTATEKSTPGLGPLALIAAVLLARR